MPAKKPRSRKPISAQNQVGSVGLVAKIQLEVDTGLEPIYANYADVAQSQYDVELNFARVPARLSPEQLATVRDGMPLLIFPAVKVVLPKAILPGLVSALNVHIAAMADQETAN